MQAVGQQEVLRADHVVVVVVREPRVQAVARLARLAVADAVGKDDEVLRGVEQLSGAEQLAAECARQEPCARAAGAVHDHDGVLDHARGVTVRRADRAVVQCHRRQRLATRERKSVDDEVAFDRGGEVGRTRRHRAEQTDAEQRREAGCSHG